MVPIALKAVPMTSKMVWMIDWNTAMMELTTAMMAPKMEETKFPRESMREGIFAIVVDLFGLGFVLCCCVQEFDIDFISTLTMTSLLS